MLNSFLLPYINTALSAVFEDLEPNQLNTSILKGSVVLRNLRIKVDALSAFSLPVDVTYGHIGKLEIKVWLIRIVASHSGQKAVNR